MNYEYNERFHQKIASRTSFVKPEHLPPTSSAAKYHSLCVFFYQVQVWKGTTDLCPLKFGWKKVEGKLLSIQMDRDVAPKSF